MLTTHLSTEKVFTSLYLFLRPHHRPVFTCLPLAATPASTAFFLLPGQGAWSHHLDSWLQAPLNRPGDSHLSIWLLHASVTTPESAPLLKTPVVKDETETGAGGLCGLRCYTYQMCKEKEFHCAVHCTLKHTQRPASS